MPRIALGITAFVALTLLCGCNGSGATQAKPAKLVFGYTMEQNGPLARMRTSSDGGETWADVAATFRPGSDGGVGCGMDATGASRLFGWNKNQLIEIVAGLGASNWETIQGPNQMNPAAPGAAVFESTHSPPAFQHLEASKWLVASRTSSNMAGLWLYDSATYKVLGTAQTPIAGENSGVDTRPQVARLYKATNTDAAPSPTVLVWGKNGRQFSAVTTSRITPDRSPADWQIREIATGATPRSNLALTADRQYFYLAFVHRPSNPGSGSGDGTEENRVRVLRSSDGLTWTHYSTYENVDDAAPKISAAALGDGRVLVIGAGQGKAHHSFAVILSSSQPKVLNIEKVFGMPSSGDVPRLVAPGSAISVKAAQIP